MKKLVLILCVVLLGFTAMSQKKVNPGDMSNTAVEQFKEKLGLNNAVLLRDSTYIKSQIDAKFESLFAGTYDRGSYRYRVQRDSTIIPNWSGLKTNLVASYSFDETVGSTATNYIVGGVGNGTITGATINQTGKVGKCYSFDGSGDYVVVADHNNLDLTDYWTVCFWVTIQIPPTAVRSILSKNSYAFGVNNGVSDRILFSSQAKSFTNTFTNDAWCHITFVNNNGQLTCYVDKVNKGTETITNPTANTDQLAIGAVYWTGSSQWIGKIDEVHIWKGRALSSTDVGLVYDLEVAGQNASKW